MAFGFRKNEAAGYADAGGGATGATAEIETIKNILETVVIYEGEVAE
jgi:hypothetical protein